MYSVCSHYASHSGVSPFGYLRIEAYLQLPAAFRSLSRPSSAPNAKAFPLRSLQLDLYFAVLSSSLNYMDNILFFGFFQNCIFFPQLNKNWITLSSLSFNFLFFPLLLSFLYIYSVLKVPSGGLKWTRTTDLTIISRVL